MLSGLALWHQAPDRTALKRDNVMLRAHIALLDHQMARMGSQIHAWETYAGNIRAAQQTNMGVKKNGRSK